MLVRCRAKSNRAEPQPLYAIVSPDLLTAARRDIPAASPGVISGL
jgi:hypothetical protein